MFHFKNTLTNKLRKYVTQLKICKIDKIYYKKLFHMYFNKKPLFSLEILKWHLQ